MEEKRKDLKAEKQKKLLLRIVEDISRVHSDFYYRPTTEIAFEIAKYIKDGEALSVEERDILRQLNPYDIQLILSLQTSNCC